MRRKTRREPSLRGKPTRCKQAEAQYARIARGRSTRQARIADLTSHLNASSSTSATLQQLRRDREPEPNLRSVVESAGAGNRRPLASRLGKLHRARGQRDCGESRPCFRAARDLGRNRGSLRLVAINAAFLARSVRRPPRTRTTIGRPLRHSRSDQCLGRNGK